MVLTSTDHITYLNQLTNTLPKPGKIIGKIENKSGFREADILNKHSSLCIILLLFSLILPDFLTEIIILPCLDLNVT
jgi:hypothetical protein